MHPLLTSRKSNQRYLKFFERFIIETDTISHSIFFSIISISRFYQSMTCPSFKDISFYFRMQFSNFSSSNPPSLRYIFNLISLLIVRLIGSFDSLSIIFILFVFVCIYNSHARKINRKSPLQISRYREAICSLGFN